MTCNLRSLALLTSVFAVAIFGPVASASAAVYTPAPNSLAGNAWTATPGYTKSWLSDQPNGPGGDFGGLGADNLKSVLESSAWLNVGLAAAGGGGCAEGWVSCSGGSASYSGPAANVFAVHLGGGRGGGYVLAFLYPTAITDFAISNLPNGVSFIRAFNVPTPVPLPAALPLFATILAGGGLIAWRRNRRKLT